MTSVSSSTIPTVSTTSSSPQTVQSSSDGGAATAVTISSAGRSQAITVSSTEHDVALVAGEVPDDAETVQHISSDDDDAGGADEDSEDLELLEARSQAAEAKLKLLEAQRRSARSSRASGASSARASRRPSTTSISSANLATNVTNVQSVLIPVAERRPMSNRAAHRPVETPVPAEAPVLPLSGRADHPVMVRLRTELTHAKDVLSRHERRAHGAGVWTPVRHDEEPIRALRSRIDDLEAMLHGTTMKTPGDSAAGPILDEPDMNEIPTQQMPPMVEIPVQPQAPLQRPQVEELQQALQSQVGITGADGNHAPSVASFRTAATAASQAVVPPPGLAAPATTTTSAWDRPTLYEIPGLFDLGVPVDQLPGIVPVSAGVNALVTTRPPSGPPSDSSSSSTSSSRSSSPRRTSSKKKDKKHKKEKKRAKERRRDEDTKPYKVKSGDIKLQQWPTTTAFPAWRRALRQAVISASERPERARPWIFAVEADDVTMEELACADDDKHRTLDAKLAEALSKVLKGEPARKVALAAERAALTQEVLSGRQCLLLIYQEFRRHEAKSDASAYSNLEAIKCGATDASLESFLTLWDNLLLTFKTPPSQDHLFTAFSSRVRHLPGLATTMAHLKRIPYGHPEKTYAFLKEACHSLVEELRTERQLAEVAKVYKTGGAEHALVMTDAEKKKAPCFALRDGKTCPAGARCAYSHDPKVIAEAKAKKQEKDKSKAKPDAGKGESKDKNKGKGKGKGGGKNKPSGQQVCWHFNQPSGCQKGSACKFLHESPAMAASTASKSATTSGGAAPSAANSGRASPP